LVQLIVFGPEPYGSEPKEPIWPKNPTRPKCSQKSCRQDNGRLQQIFLGAKIFFYRCIQI